MEEAWDVPGGYPCRNDESCLTNVDGYYLSLARKAMRLAVATAYQSQIVNEYCQDILFGIPKPHRMRVDLGVLDPDYVSILPNGHEPFLGFAMVQLAREKKWQEEARKTGAKGLRVIANIETGQEMIQRWEMDDVFYGFTGNWIMQEAVLGSGCVDLFACDMNCSMPVDPLYAKKYKFKLVPVSELVAFEGVEERIDYVPAVLSYGTCTDTGRIADLLKAINDALGGVPISDLPVVAAAPEYMDQKATIDAVFALAFGLYTNVNPIPTVTGAPDLVKLLTGDIKGLTGGQLSVETDPVKAVDGMLSHIEANRHKLGIRCWPGGSFRVVVFESSSFASSFILAVLILKITPDSSTALIRGPDSSHPLKKPMAGKQS